MSWWRCKKRFIEGKHPFEGACQHMKFRFNFNIFAKLTALITIMALTFPQTGFSITIKEEKDMSREFMKAISGRIEIIEDPTIKSYINELGNKILTAVPPQPFKYHFYVVNEATYNAFASPAGHIFINSGLFAAMSEESELAGIIGHEIAHVVCRHISQRIEASKKIGMATLAGMVAGVLLGVGGSAAAANALTVGSVAAGQTATLSFSRQNEMQADQLGLNYLKDSGYSARGLLGALKTIRSKQWYGSKQVPTYLMTHPASEERMAYIDTWIERNEKTLSDKNRETGKFPLAHTRIKALFTDPQGALAGFNSDIKKNPRDFMALYGKGLVLSRTGKRAEAITFMKKALEQNAMATYILQDLGKIYFQEGNYEKALLSLEHSVGKKDPDGLFFKARTHMELGHLDLARDIFIDIVSSHESYTQAYYFLGEAYGKMGDLYHAHYNLGLFYLKKRDLKNADFHLKRAMTKTDDPSKKAMAKKMLKKVKPPEKKKGKKE